MNASRAKSAMTSPSSKAEILEATAKILDGKWKKRQIVFQKLSFVNFGTLRVYKPVKWHRKSSKKRTITIEGVFGVESGFLFNNEKHTLAVISQNVVVVLAFENQATLGVWEWSIRRAFGQSFQYTVFPVEMPSSVSDVLADSNAPIRLHLRNGGCCLVTDTPPRLLAHFRFREIRRYGAFENKFCLEVGSKSGQWSGVYVFRTGHCDQMAFTFRLASFDQLQEYISKEKKGNEEITETPAAAAIASIASPPLDYVKVECSKSASEENAGSYQSSAPQSAKSASTSFSLWDVNAPISPVEYAEIDRLATQAVRKARKDDSRKRSISTQFSCETTTKTNRRKSWFQGIALNLRASPRYQRIR